MNLKNGDTLEHLDVKGEYWTVLKATKTGYRLKHPVGYVVELTAHQVNLRFKAAPPAVATPEG